VRRFQLLGCIAIAAAWIASAAGAAHADGVDPLSIPDAQLEPVEWTDLDRWAVDDHTAALAAFLASCKPYLAAARPSDPRPLYAGLWRACRDAKTAPSDDDGARKFFEQNFRPVRIAKLGESTGLLTGYYEPIVEGSRFPNPEFHWPLYRRPRDLLVNGKKPPAAGIPNRAAVGRLNAKNQVEPYYDRRAIENGALDGQHLEICWLRDPFEAMAIEIEGSVRVRLEDGTLLRLNYDAHNGFARKGVGRLLIERSLLRPEEISKERIRLWMAAHPDEAKEVRAANRSYTFFRVTGLDNEDQPTGAQGSPLVPGRSIAVDGVHVFGTPFFIEADFPLPTGGPAVKFRRLMIAQDTGSAIVGPARADIYWGAGDLPGRVAGRIRQQARFVMLLPRELDMIEAGKAMPLPQPKPPIPQEAVAKEREGDQQQSRNAGAENVPAGRPVRAPARTGSTAPAASVPAARGLR
jgi:membrane-bound lytic murein transglycosylase A